MWYVTYNQKKKTMNAQILQEMPETFTRRDLLKAVISKGYAPNKGDQILERYTLSGELERIERGRYQKVEKVNH